MINDPHNRPQRRSIRLRDFDYSQNGAYYVTICVQHRMELFGAIVDGKMVLNDAGKMALRIWNEIPLHYQDFHVEAIQIMPNHLHGILLVLDSPTNHQEGDHGRTRGSVPTRRLALSDVIQRYKTLTTRLYIDGVRTQGWTPFTRRLWQGRYYERVLRNERELEDRREYIINNPLRWHIDEYNKQQSSE